MNEKQYKAFLTLWNSCNRNLHCFKNPILVDCRKEQSYAECYI